MDTFKCIGCKKSKIITDNDIKKDGKIYSKCLACRNQSKIYFQQNKANLYEKTKEWRAEHKEITKLNNAIYYEEHKDDILNNCKKYYDNNREKIAEYKREWRLRKIANNKLLPTDFN